ncbi:MULTISPECIES: hypothetical protein [unclassified Pseudofrankia]|uniref:hypothetical protein n=1 Tax=unclassified Pseudofrankia TaxID=2994372 RepID=UPI0008D9C161|nr:MULTISPECIES: hypothetical protein [unclassified Pseudofrankia]MDT3439813.1 hypothetical protein [Pseudofrankia sp. BMG5.37]OHV44851.1 hypothetical protein BCD48_24420 [Pseudofrankia sp. BMG5.36]
MTLTEPELRSHLRALSDQRPTPGLGPAFPDRIRDGAHRRRAHSRIAAAFVLVLALAGLPLGLLAITGGDTKADPTAASAGPSYGGVTATWLPSGMTHTVDNAVVPDTSPQQGPLGPIRFYRRDVDTPWLTIQGLRLAPGVFLSQFTAASPSATPATHSPSPTGPGSKAEPDQLWITVSWAPPDGTGLDTLTKAMKDPTLTNSPHGKVTTSARTVNGRPAILATVDDPGLPAWAGAPGDYNYDALLAWSTPSGALLTVESATVAPTDLAALQHVAEGLVLGTRPPSPTAPPAPDAATRTAILGALHNAFSPGVTADQFAASVQGGDALTATHTRLLAGNPQLGPQIEPPTNAEAGRIELIDPNTATAIFNLTYDVPIPAGSSGTPARTIRVTYYRNAIVTRTAAGWQVNRDTFCDTTGTMGVEPGCPPA